jgi:glyoxylase-like metal-dependent hydrolase (beta-lactamase superfamily II)
MQLSNSVHLVGSGQNGFSLTDRLDCHVYLLDGGSELALIDTGAGRDVPAIVAEIKAAGFNPGNIAKILITHLHLDHAGGAAELQELTGAEILASQDVAGWLETGDEAAASLVAARQTDMYPSENRLRAVASATGIVDGDIVDVGMLKVTTVKADGHSRGHLAFLVDDGVNRALFSGDALFPGGRILLQNIWDCSLEESIATVKRFAGLEFTQFFPGHASISLQDGKRHIDAAMEHINQLMPPPQLET